MIKINDIAADRLILMWFAFGATHSIQMESALMTNVTVDEAYAKLTDWMKAFDKPKKDFYKIRMVYCMAKIGDKIVPQQTHDPDKWESPDKPKLTHIGVSSPLERSVIKDWLLKSGIMLSQLEFQRLCTAMASYEVLEMYKEWEKNLPTVWKEKLTHVQMVPWQSS
jgi:hypothetical protein